MMRSFTIALEQSWQGLRACDEAEIERVGSQSCCLRIEIEWEHVIRMESGGYFVVVVGQGERIKDHELNDEQGITIYRW